MDNDGFAKQVIVELRHYYVVCILILVVCLSVACIYAMSQPTIYQSELTFVVKMAQPLSEKDNRLQEISKMAVSEEVRKPIGVDNIDGKFNADLLGEDLCYKNVRVQNLNTLNMFRIFAHGNTPEEAQQTCAGVYEHFAAFSEKYNSFNIDVDIQSGPLIEEVQKKINESKEAYAKSIETPNAHSDGNLESFDEEKRRLYNNYSRWEGTYQGLLIDELRAKWYNSWQVSLVDKASLPERPIPKRTGFIICVGFTMGALLCLLFGTIIVLKSKNKRV